MVIFHSYVKLPEGINLGIGYHWKITILMGQLTISMAIFNSHVKLPEGNLFILRQIHMSRVF